VAIYWGDCREVLPKFRMPVDLVLADPPYGDTEFAWDVRDAAWLALAAPLLKPSGSVWCFGSLRSFLGQAEAFAGWKLAQEIVWEKSNGSNFHADRFRRVHELALQLYRGRWKDVWKQPVTTPDALAKRVRRKNRPAHLGRSGGGAFVSRDGGPRLMRSVIRAPNSHGDSLHPVQKPLEVVAPIIAYSCPVRGVVLDPTMGSGTTLLAAKAHGRRAIGIEIDRAMCDVAVRRLASTEESAQAFSALPLQGERQLGLF
jgi:site-specific DNA-methyltransferase (adenine-specific)